MNDLLCADCGNELKEAEAPAPLFKIPFTNLEIWRWEKQKYCLNCCGDQDRREHEQIYDAGAQDGYEAGLRDAERT